MKAIDLDRHLREKATWVDWRKTVDTFKAGDPETEVNAIAVGWMSTQAALAEAHRRGCNFFVTHEPTFYNHEDNDAWWFETESAKRKCAFLEETQMVVYRCHDVWDQMPDVGIPDSWGRYLGLGEPDLRQRFYNRYSFAPMPAYELAQQIAHKVADLGQANVELIGPGDRMVGNVVLGTGAITHVPTMLAMGAQAVLASDDGIRYWQMGAYLGDMDVPLLVVNHATSEWPGMISMAEYLRKQFSPMRVELIGPTPIVQWVPGPRRGGSQVAMVLGGLSDLSAVEPPAGYRVARVESGHEQAYVEVMAGSIYPGCQPEWFEQTFARDEQYAPGHLMLMWHGGEPVAAAAAWHDTLDGEPIGLIHMVGTVAAHRGKGLGTAVTLAALHRLGERGFTRAMLATDDWRIPAIKAYLRLGFKPLHRDGTHEGRWQAILRRIETTSD